MDAHADSGRGGGLAITGANSDKKSVQVSRPTVTPSACDSCTHARNASRHTVGTVTGVPGGAAAAASTACRRPRCTRAVSTSLSFRARAPSVECLRQGWEGGRQAGKQADKP
jgi:hypothetical protein